MIAQQFSDKLQHYCESLIGKFNIIPIERKAILRMLGKYIVLARKESSDARLVFICTHNSRRSQFGQIWASTAIHYYGIDRIKTYSGGTEITSFNILAVKALERAGFTIELTDNHPDNPGYLVKDGDHFASDIIFSKKFDDPPNPRSGFCVVMTCSQADATCPFVPGTDERVSLPYDDLKEYDETPEENEKYDERCRQIGREMFYAMDYVKSKL